MGETWISRDFPQMKTEIVTMSQTQNPVPVCEEHSCKNLLVMRWVVAVQSVFLMFIGYQIDLGQVGENVACQNEYFVFCCLDKRESTLDY